MRPVYQLVAASIAALSFPLHAATVVDTGAPSRSTNFEVGPGQSLAGLVTIGEATRITGIDGFFSGFDSSTITIGVAGLDANGLPGATLFSGSFQKGFPDQWLGLSGLDWLVSAGDYWITFAADRTVGMDAVAQRPLANYAFSQSGIWYEYRPLNLSLRVFGDPAAVPEPATWLMLAFGFGLAGTALRGTRGRPSAA